MTTNFIRFTLVWVSQNLSIPFWMVGHVHLSMNVYADIHEILMSFGMNIIELFNITCGLHVIVLASNSIYEVQVFHVIMHNNSHGIIYIPCVLYDCDIWRTINLN